MDRQRKRGRATRTCARAFADPPTGPALVDAGRTARRARLCPSRRRRRDRHESRPLRLRSARMPASWLAVDFGVAFEAQDDLPGVDLIFPDIAYLEEERAEPRRHRHHPRPRGSFRRADRPLAAAPRAGLRDRFTAGLLAAKLASEPGAEVVPVTVVNAGEPLHRRPVRASNTSTSRIPCPSRMRSRSARRSALSSIAATGSSTRRPWSAADRRGPAQEVGGEGVLALVCDSTNAMREGHSPSEAEVARELAESSPTPRARIAFTTFASNVEPAPLRSRSPPRPPVATWW